MDDIYAAHEQLVFTITQRMADTGGRLTTHGGFISYDMGCESADVHLRGITIGPGADLPELVNEARALDAERKWNIWVLGTEFDRVARALGPEGFLPRGTPAPVMIRSEPIDQPIGHAVSMPAAGEQLAPVARRIAECFELAEFEAAAFVDRPSWIDSENAWAAAVIEDGEAVSCGLATMNPADRMAGLYYIGTAPDHRGRGLGGDVVTALTNEAFKRGSRAVILQASDLGARVYSRLRYRNIGSYRRLSNRDDD